jgi:hypothetical protein
MGAPEATSTPTIVDPLVVPGVTPPAKVEPPASPEPKSKEKEPPAGNGKTAPAPDAATKGKKDDDKTPITGDDDEPHPDEEGIIKMPLTSFQRRLARATRSELKRLFGTDSVHDIVAMKQELDKRRNDDEEARKKSLAEIDRIKEDHAKEKTRAEKAEARAADLEEQQLAEQEDTRIRGIAVEHVKGRYYRVAANDLREHLIEEFKDDFSKVTEKYLSNWFKQYAKDNPELAVPPEPTDEEKKAAAAAAASGRAPITNGPNATRPQQPTSGGPTGKDPRPGRPNSMTPAEWNQYKREKGWNF